MGCVSSVNFAVILNGQPGNKFAPSKGLQQREPLSPYLFLLVSDVLSMMLQSAVERKHLEGVKVKPHGPIISHIFFADDTFIFLRATRMNCCNLVKIIDDYYAASGQAIKLQKSCVFFGANTPTVMSTELGQVLNMSMVSNPGTYLGVPAM